MTSPRIGRSARPRTAAVIGGGVGGLAVAIRLQTAGIHVTVLERNELMGGKLAVLERDGFTFDIGPSLVTLPHVFDELFRLAGTSLADEVDLVRLDPQFRYHWPDGASLDIADDPSAVRTAVEAFAPGEGAHYAALQHRAARIWDVSERTFFAGPMSGPVSLMRRLRSPRDLTDIDPFTTVAGRARKTFDDPRLHQWLGRYATYSGSSPYRAPATLACIPSVEARFGCWYPLGGLGSLRDAFVRVAERCGVELRTGCEVAAITTADDGVDGVRLVSGERVEADIVVANVDALHLYRDLMPVARQRAKVERAERSTSGFVIVAGVSGTTTGIAHHNVWFSSDARKEFDDIDSGLAPDDPTVYACVSSVTDPSQAPAGHENWFLLVNTPPRPERVPPSYAANVWAALRRHGVDLDHRVLFSEVLTPADIESRYRSVGGAIYGTSSNGRQAAFRRPANRGPVRGLYLVGGSSHPGGGLPLVTMSARIVADMIEADRR